MAYKYSHSVRIDSRHSCIVLDLQLDGLGCSILLLGDSLFMLCSSVIKERLYIGEATVATLCGIIFGPHAANLINPGTWGNVERMIDRRLPIKPDPIFAGDHGHSIRGLVSAAYCGTRYLHPSS